MHRQFKGFCKSKYLSNEQLWESQMRTCVIWLVNYQPVRRPETIVNGYQSLCDVPGESSVVEEGWECLIWPSCSSWCYRKTNRCTNMSTKKKKTENSRILNSLWHLFIIRKYSRETGRSSVTIIHCKRAVLTRISSLHIENGEITYIKHLGVHFSIYDILIFAFCIKNIHNKYMYALCMAAYR